MTQQPFASYEVTEANSLGRSAATVLAYLRRWLKYAKIEHEGKRWIYRSLTQIAADCGLSKSTVQRAIALLIKRGLLLKARLRQRCWQSICHYALNFTIAIDTDAPQDSHSEPVEVVKPTSSSKLNNKSNKKTNSRPHGFGQLARQAADTVATWSQLKRPQGFIEHPSGYQVLPGEWPCSIG